MREATVRSLKGQPCRIACAVPLTVLCNGKAVAAKQGGKVLTFATEAGKTYLLAP